MTPAPVSLELIVAVAANGVIGRGNQLPWHLPDDLKRFKSLTLGNPIIMGRRTYESIGRPLPGRRSIVVSTTWKHPPVDGVEVAGSLESAETLVSGRAFVIGGAVLFETALPRATVLHLTELDEAVIGDVYFPTFDRSQWRLVEEIRHDPDDRHAMGFWFRTYRKL